MHTEGAAQAADEANCWHINILQSQAEISPIVLALCFIQHMRSCHVTSSHMLSQHQLIACSYSHFGHLCRFSRAALNDISEQSGAARWLELALWPTLQLWGCNKCFYFKACSFQVLYQMPTNCDSKISIFVEFKADCSNVIFNFRSRNKRHILLKRSCARMAQRSFLYLLFSIDFNSSQKSFSFFYLEKLQLENWFWEL